MEFGTLIFTKPQRAITDPKLAEDYGYSHAWIPDSHMIWGDVWACMALAAVNTTKIKLATGVAIATNRIPPVTVEAIGTINEIAPGRVILGFGTGHTGRRVMGLPPVKHAAFREEVRVIHDLLRDGEATYNTGAMSRKIRYIQLVIAASSASRDQTMVRFHFTSPPTVPRRLHWRESSATAASPPASPAPIASRQ